MGFWIAHQHQSSKHDQREGLLQMAAGNQDVFSDMGLVGKIKDVIPMIASQPRVEGGNIVFEIDEGEYTKGVLDNQLVWLPESSSRKKMRYQLRRSFKLN